MVKTSKDSFSDAYEVEDNVGFSCNHCNGILFSILIFHLTFGHLIGTFPYGVAFI